MFEEDTWERQYAREKLEFAYGAYTSEIRKNMLAKNIERPTNIYDIIYSKTRENMLAKNIKPAVFNTNIESTSETIRDAQLSKHVETQVNLEASGENIRNAQLSKNTLLNTVSDIEKLGDQFRNAMLAKNSIQNKSIGSSSEKIRENQLSSNVDKPSSIEFSSVSARKSELSKNIEKSSNITSSSILPREKELSSNVPKNSSIETSSIAPRTSELAANKTPNNPGIEKYSIAPRASELASNTISNSSIETTSAGPRTSELSSNVEKISNIAASSAAVREKMLATNNKNVPDSSVEKSSAAPRNAELASNIVSNSDIASSSVAPRTAELASNVISNSNIETSSVAHRTAELTSNISKNTDISASSKAPRESELSSNIVSNSSIESSSATPRAAELASNVPSTSSIATSSAAPRNAELASNVPSTSSIATSSATPRAAELASNVVSTSSIETSSVAPRNAELASNVPSSLPDITSSSTGPRNAELASNIVSISDIATSSVIPRNQELASNVVSTSDIATSSVVPRNQELAANLPDTNPDIATSSVIPRNQELAANLPDTNPGIAITSIGPRNQELAANLPDTNPDIETSSAIYRNQELATNVPNIPKSISFDSQQARASMLSKNISSISQIEDLSSVFRHNMLSINNSGNNPLGTNILIGGTSMFVGISNLEIMSAPIRAVMELENVIQEIIGNNRLQADYGLGISPVDGVTPVSKITNAAQLYNLQQNTYSNIRYSDKTSAYNVLSNHHTDGFQQLLAAYGGITPRIALGRETNTTPAIVISNNKGAYIGRPTTEPNESSVTKLLRPVNGPIGSAESMVSNTVPSDAILNDFNPLIRGINLQIRGIKHILKVIKAKANSEDEGTVFSNLNTQVTTKFITGQGKFAYQRYTVANPYQSNRDAGSLEFKITNYAITNGNPSMSDTMSFPPYIKSFANSDSANWNKIDFLGRPEPIFTYSNSSREGSMSFYVLTDFSQKIDLGYDYPTDRNPNRNPKNILNSANLDGGDFPVGAFTKNSSTNSDVQIKDLEAKIALKKIDNSKIQAQIEEVYDTSGVKQGFDETATLRAQIATNETEINQLQTTLTFLQNTSTIEYKEFSKKGGNIYNTLMSADGGNLPSDSNGEYSTRSEDTISRLTRMKKDLIFQPAFFSGDKVDFINRIEFLSKMTRPSRNNSQKGFSYIYPPICHLTLGTWFNHDVVVNNVSYDYSDATWSLDGSKDGKVQPMWALVTIAFNIIGTYGGTPGSGVPMATDNHGFYWKTDAPF